jgi:hypothetical protein
MITRTIYFNEDNHHFYGAHPPEDMSVEGVQRLVDFYAVNTQVAGILFCVNVQRALFDSRVWERFWDGYDPALGEEQPALKRTHGVKNGVKGAVLPKLISDFHREQVSQGSDHVHHSRRQAQAPLVSRR